MEVKGRNEQKCFIWRNQKKYLMNIADKQIAILISHK
jgi:hypothetical protein